MGPQVVHLHNHTAYSLQDGIARPQEMAAVAAADGQPSLASTDHGTLAGIWRFAQAARAAGVKPICGMEGYLAIGSRHEQNVLTVNGDIGDADADAGGKTKRYHHLTMLAATPEGWRNLVRINNTAQREGFWYKPRFDWEVLNAHRGGIIYGTGCVGGPVASPILQGDLPGAKAALAALVDIAGRDNVFVEVMSHGVAEEAVVLPALVKLAREFGLPVVATNDAHYLCEDDAVAHDAWLAMGSKTTIADPNRFKFRGTGYHLRTAAQMHSVFDALPGCEQAVANTLMVAEKIDDNVLPESKMRLPHFKIPDGFPDAATYLKHLVREGAIKRYGMEWSQEITQRLRYEFDVIVGAGLEDYFLIVWDLVAWARSNGIRVGPGRGSAAGAMLSYCLGITNIEPLANDLLFERFLNPERVGLPDVDIDFEAAHKTAVLNYLVSKYGEDRVARLATYGMTRSRAAVKGAARALGLPTTLGDRLSKLIPVIGGKPMSFAGMDDAGSSVAAFHELVATDPDAARVVALARTIEDVPGNAGIHACGVIVSDTAFDDLGIPVRIDRKGSGGLVVDWDGKDAGDSSDGGVGLLKLDRLGLRNLDIVAACVEAIKQTTGEDIDPDLIDPSADDERARATWAMLSSGRTAGVFQIESAGMTKLCEGMSPHSLNDLSALVALYRPGPMGAGMHDRYVSRKRGAEAVSYGYLTNVPAEIAVLESVLGSTYGVLAYQEQLQQLSKVVAGFTPGQSNKLLKAFAKKRREVMDALEEPFMTGGMSTVAADGAPKVAFRETTLRELWRTFKASSEYLFNRCLTGNTVVKNADGKCWTVESLYRATAADPTTCPMCGKPGDPFCGSCTVLAAWFDRDKIAPSVVKDVHDNGLQHVWTVRLVDGRQVTGTDNHRLLSTQGWTEIRDLRAGDRLMTEWSGLPAWTAIETIRYTGKAPTFDLEMADGTDHNFLANGIVSHNSHSAAYGQISYITAYLKANWTDLYCAALLAKTDNNDRRHAILSALREEGIAVLPPSVNLGGLVTGAENGCVRLGLSEIKDVGSNAAAVIAERDKNGPYSSLADLTARSGVNAKVLGALIDSGACDEFGPRQGMFSVARAVRIDQGIHVPDMEWGILERAARERDRLGVCVTGHPVTALREQIAAWRDPRGGAVPMPVHWITTDHDGKSVSAVGVIASWSEAAYSGGRRANFVLEGSAGELPCVMWNREVAALHKAGQVPRIGDLVAVVGQATVRTFDVRLDGRADDEVEDDESTVTETITRVEMRASRIVPVTVNAQGRQHLADVVPLRRAAKPEPTVEVKPEADPPDEDQAGVVIELHTGKPQPDVLDVEVSFMDDELDSWLQTDPRWLAFMPCFRSSDMHRTFMNWLELCSGSPVPSPIYTAADGTRLRFVISEHADPDELKNLVTCSPP